MGKKTQIELFKKSAKAYAISTVFFLVVIGVIGLLLCYGPLPEKGITNYVLFAMTASCFLIGIMAGSIVKKRGLIYGAGYAAVFILVVLLAAFVASGCQDPIGLLNVRWLIALLFGGIGGILGVNLKN